MWFIGGAVLTPCPLLELQIVRSCICEPLIHIEVCHNRRDVPQMLKRSNFCDSFSPLQWLQAKAMPVSTNYGLRFKTGFTS